MDQKKRFEEDRALVEEALDAFFRGEPNYQTIYKAMRYSLLAGGKRIRPILLLESCRMCGGSVEEALPYACAIEMVHTYSLIHDDLPCMDDDDYRRGRLTNHRVFGEAAAVLAGDGLLTAAFETMLSPKCEALGLRGFQAAGVLARAAGADGMVGGQILDLEGEGKELSLSQLEELVLHKTGDLLTAAAEMGCILAGGGSEEREAVRTYARKVGLAFQIRDDILDVTGDAQKLGKATGMDEARGKSTYVRLLGLDRCRELVEECTREAGEALSGFEDREFLCWLAQLLAGREQ